MVTLAVLVRHGGRTLQLAVGCAGIAGTVYDSSRTHDLRPDTISGSESQWCLLHYAAVVRDAETFE